MLLFCNIIAQAYSGNALAKNCHQARPQRGSNMRQTSNRHERSAATDKLLHKLYTQAKAQFGSAVKSFWFYDGDLCPACNQREIDLMKIKGKEALSLNAFIYRENGTLIGYFLCAACAKQVFKDARKNPYTETAVHVAIEQNLIAAYHLHLKKMETR
jgi:hypothetical protein